MDNELCQRKYRSLNYCDRLRADLALWKEEARTFFGGEIYQAYIKATDQAIEKVQEVRAKIRNIQ